MKTRSWSLHNICNLGGAITLAVLALGLVGLTGCERRLEPGETYHKTAIAWPLFDVEKTEGVDGNGLRWSHEKSDAVIWLASSDKLHKFDKQGEQIYRKERKTFIPIYSVNVEEDEQSIKTWGIILLYPYNSSRLKAPTVAMPMAPVNRR